MVGTYLMFNGNCGEALALYEKAFGAKIREIQKYGDMPPDPRFPADEKMKERVLHGVFVIDGTEIMCADSSTGTTASDNMYLSVTSRDESLVKKAWEVLKTGGKIYMELQPAFFALQHGSLQDEFGVNWMFTVPK